MYNINVQVKYNDNYSYRACLRNVTNMKKNNINVPWDQMDSDLDNETKDELLYDSVIMTTIMDNIYEKTKEHTEFKELYSLAAAQMFSVDHCIGLAILFSYDYFEFFHNCLIDFYQTNRISINNYKILKNKLC
jgi:hypothetical protein